MTEKRFNVFDVDGTVFLEDHKEGSYHIGEKENVDIPCLNDIADRLNTYADENEQLKTDKMILEHNHLPVMERKIEKYKMNVDALTETNDFLNEKIETLSDENEQLKSKNRGLQSELQIFKEDVTHSNLQINKLAEENEQLKQRNNRQYEQLDRLYNLIEQKDWRALNDILDDFKKSDEQLQKEWRTYGDMND